MLSKLISFEIKHISKTLVKAIIFIIKRYVITFHYLDQDF